MIKSMLRIIAFAAVLFASIIVNRFLERLWLSFTGLESNGLSSLFTLLLMIFFFTLLLPIKHESRIKMNIMFKEVFIFILIWISASFFIALLHQPKHASIGLIPAISYAFLKLVNPSFRLRILLKEHPEASFHGTILMWVAPTPGVSVARGLGLRSILKVLRGEARIAVNIPGEIFVKSCKNIRNMELKGSLASFVKTVVNNWNREAAIVCEAKPGEGFFKIRVKIASDNIQVLNNITKRFSKLDGEEDVNWALEKWLSLKPCVKPIMFTNNGFSLPPEIIPEKLLVAGNAEETEKFALKACLSQLRINSNVLIIDGEEDPCFEEKVEKILRAEGFKPLRRQPKAFRTGGRMEVILIKKTELNGKLIEKVSSKPLVAVWLKGCLEEPELSVPLKILTYNMLRSKPVLEADGLILLNPDRELLNSFLSKGQSFLPQGKTIMVSTRGVRILA